LSANLTDRQKVIAEYWKDGPNSETPPGHWCLLAEFVSQRDHHSLDMDVKMYFMIANAVFDASIAAWDAKRAFDSIRPASAIPFLFQGQTISAWGGPNQGTVQMDDGQWIPYQTANFPTPPFPEYISGHSTFSAAAATILALFTGSDRFGGSVTISAHSSTVESNIPANDVTLSWKTFSEAADEAGI
jgi:VCPO second helical-bundle domain